MADLRAQLEEGLAERYRIERELGRGGMATVFLAHDLRHDRPVALKVLHPHLGNALGAERFEREIRLAARLQHPHILTVHDSGETSGLLWFTMPFVEGESLRARLDREKQLPLDDALRIAREAAQALQYAHDHGVVHRDIKPENILLTEDGSTLVADFGIARSLSAGDVKLTETGMAIGTPAYMSPEQASGGEDFDARTDVYSLGAVLYEMLAGDPPFTGPTPQAVIARRFSGEAPDIRRTRSTVPEPVAAAIARALAVVPADRFASARAFSEALAPHPHVPLQTATETAAPAALAGARRMSPALSMLLLGLLVGAGILFAWRARGPEGTRSDIRLIGVLPFENLGDSSDAYFADGITDAVRNRLGDVPGVEVIARGSSTPYKGTRLTPREIANELGVQYLLTGTVRRVKTADGERLLVHPELVEIVEGAAPKARWGEAMGAPLTDVFEVQADIAQQVAAELGVALGAEAREQVAERPTENLAAYDAYLQGEAITDGFGTNDPPLLRAATAHYERATALDPRFALAWARLSQAKSLTYANSVPSSDLGEEARTAAERALQLAPERADGYIAMGLYLSLVKRDYAAEAKQYESGLRIAPANAELLSTYALNLQDMGKWDSSLVLLRRAKALDPRSVQLARRLAGTYLELRRYDEAEAEGLRAAALAPTSFPILQINAAVHLGRGDLDAARRVIASASPDMPRPDLVAYMAWYSDLYWVLDDEQTDLLLRLGRAAFDGDAAARGAAFAQAYRLRGDAIRAAAYADTAAREYSRQIEDAPDDCELHALRGLMLAYTGRKAEAIGEGLRGKALDGQPSYCHHQLVRIYLAVGEPEKALDELEPLLRVPYWLSPGWLRIDPDFAPLRGNPRFERLAGRS